MRRIISVNEVCLALFYNRKEGKSNVPQRDENNVDLPSKMNIAKVLGDVKDREKSTPHGVRRGAISWPTISTGDFNPHTPCGMRQRRYHGGGSVLLISIRAPRVGCDWDWRTCITFDIDFNPRTPRGVRHVAPAKSPGHRSISIHAPRVGCDLRRYYCYLRRTYFNPRTPRGVRLP